MTQQTLAQTRVVDPILTTHARGFQRPGNVWPLLFPAAPVDAYAGQIIEFGKESFRRYNTKRAPGSETKAITFGYQGKPFVIQPNALDALVPRENMVDAGAVPGLDLASDAVDLVLDTMELAQEWECADLARNATLYPTNNKLALTGTDRWGGSTGKPTTDVKKALEAIRKSIGMSGNTVILPPSAYNALDENAQIRDRMKYTGRDSVTTELLARIWGVQTVVVAEAVGASGQDDAFGDIWGNDVIVAYVAPPTGGNRRNAARPSYGYTYTVRGMPMVEKPVWRDSRKSWVYGVSADRTPVISGITAGFLLQNAGAPPA